MKIVLCGPPCSGKSTIAALLGAQMSWEVVDTDKEIEMLYERKRKIALSCKEIYSSEGENYFRNIEENILFSLKGVKERVVALGGGVLNYVASQEDVIVYLKTSLEILWNRMGDRKDLPAYLSSLRPKKSFETILKNRLPHYERMANVIIDTDSLNSDNVVQKIINHQRLAKYGVK